MRISLEWLQEFVAISMTPVELSDLLTMAGFEVEDIEDRRSWADGVVIGYVTDCQPHPNADKLRVCSVDIGEAEASTIVCGAANIKSGIFVPVATVGTYLPKIDIKITPRKLRGVKSYGMVCSQSELGLEKDSDGIYIFSDANSSHEFTPGEDARPYLGLDDVILDVTSTANRADALSMIGIAREVSALTGVPLSLPEISDVEVPSSAELAITVQEPQACPTYIGTYVDRVTLSPSPQWLQRRLQAAGVRPINNVVDVTNYVLLEWGQPLHAFDYDRLMAIASGTSGDNLTVGVRFARDGETLTTLDGQERQLQPQALLITAEDKPIALAGVMGGEATEVCEGTTAILLEAALFDSVAIRRSARSQSLRTEASARYERGVNQAEVGRACRRALNLLTTLTGGELKHQAIAFQGQAVASLAAAEQDKMVRTIELRQNRVNQILGSVVRDDESLGSLSSDAIEQSLVALGCTLEPLSGSVAEGTVVWRVSIPPYRYRDLEREIDLIEEVARLYGYNRFATTLPAKSEPGRLSPRYAAALRVTAALRAEGLTELVHYSLVKPESDRQIKLANPLYAEYSALRLELFSGLVDAFQYNLEQGSGALNGFELGRVFWHQDGVQHEKDLVAGIIGGDPSQGRWTQGGREQPMGWFDAKGVLESLFKQLSVPVQYQAYTDHPWLHPGRTASLWIGDRQLGLFGQIHPELRQQRELPEAVYLFELDLDMLLMEITQEGADVPLFAAYSTYPASDRDIAFFAPLTLPLAEIEQTIESAGQPLLSSVEVFDDYRGEGVPEGQRSLALRLVYRMTERTLTDEDVDPVHQNVRDTLVKTLGVTPRS